MGGQGVTEKLADSERSLQRAREPQSARGCTGSLAVTLPSLAKGVGDSSHAQKIYPWLRVEDADTLLCSSIRGSYANYSFIKKGFARTSPTPLLCSSLSVPEYLLLTWKVSQTRFPCPLFPLPHQKTRQPHTLC